MDPLRRKRAIFSMLRDEWRWALKDLLPEELTKLRRDIIFELDTKIIPHICDWPKDIRIIFFETRRELSLVEMRSLFEFLYGNGCDAMKISVWIITSQAIADRDCIIDNIRAVTELYDQICSADYNEHYFDVEQQRELELPGLNAK